MSSVGLYNTFGQLLARGAEIAVARAILRGVTVEELIELVHTRFAPITDSTTEQLINFAGRTVSGGDAWLALPKDVVPPSIIIPENPQLFGDDWFGKRVLLVVHGEIVETGSPYDLWLDLPDFTPWAEIEELIESQMQEFINNYPDAVQRLGLERVRQFTVERLVTERRY